MADEYKLRRFRENYRNYSRDKLIETIHEYVFHSEEHIVAQQLLSAMDLADSERKHQDALKVGLKANKHSKSAVLVAILALVVSLASFAFQLLDRANKSQRAEPESALLRSSKQMRSTSGTVPLKTSP
jgi:hypothetical protein